MTGALTNHLWQSTLFAVAIALVALLFRKNQAQVRYALWLNASLKFLVPFSLIFMLGSHLTPPSWKGAKHVAAPVVSSAVGQIAQPFSDYAFFAPSAPSSSRFAAALPVIIFVTWLCGFAIIALMRFRGWVRVRAAVRSSTPLNISAAVEVRSCPGLLEPGVVGLGIAGLSKPILLLPEGIMGHLTSAQLEAVLAHELCHVKRRDNLTAAMHMIVEAVFWFHPVVWWLGAKLVEERERACDEQVLRLGSEARVYAESILKLCQFYVESPLACVSGVTGSDLKKRVVRIIENQFGEALSAWKKALLAAAGAVTLGLPLVIGVLAAPQQEAQSLEAMQAAGVKMSFDTASVKQNMTNDRATRNILDIPLTSDASVETGGRFSVTGTPLRDYIYFAYRLHINLPGLPDWANTERFDIEARAQGNPTNDQYRLMMQSLLADKFKLAAHFETRQVPVYALTVADDGKVGPQLTIDNEPCSMALTAAQIQALNGPPRFSPSAEPQTIVCGGIYEIPPTQSGRFRVAGKKITLALLARAMLGPASGIMDRAVVDRTGLDGTFDFSLEWVPPGKMPGVTWDPNGPTFNQAVQDQLGLNLEPATGPVKLLIIDHIEQLSGN